MQKQHLTAAAILSLAVSAGLTATAHAEDLLIAPQPMANPQPPQPTNAEGQPVVGWVTVRYNVTKDGKVADVRAVDVMPPTIDPATTIEAVGEWTFSPGTRNAEAIDWFNNESVVIFRSQAEAPEASEQFGQDYQAIAQLLTDKKYDEAEAASQKLINQEATRLSDLGLAVAQAAVVALGKEDAQTALDLIREASDRRIPMLGGSELFPILQLRMQLEAQLGRTGDALESYKRLARGLGTQEPDPAFLKFGEKLEEDWKSTEFLPVSGRIDDKPWRIDTLRPLFYIDKVEGNIEKLDFECDTRRIQVDFQQESDYQLPEALGKCVVFVQGKPGTTFQFIEVLPK